MTKDDANKKVGNKRLSTILLLMDSDGVKGLQTLFSKLFFRFCRKVRFLGKIQKSGVRNSMTYRLSNSRKSNFATEPHIEHTLPAFYRDFTTIHFFSAKW